MKSQCPRIFIFNSLSQAFFQVKQIITPYKMSNLSLFKKIRLSGLFDSCLPSSEILWFSVSLLKEFPRIKCKHWVLTRVESRIQPLPETKGLEVSEILVDVSLKTKLSLGCPQPHTQSCPRSIHTPLVGNNYNERSTSLTFSQSMNTRSGLISNSNKNI